MKAVVYEKYGPPEVLELKEVAKPTPKDDEVLVKVHAASINDWDWGLLQGGHPRLWGLLKPKYKILGSDIAGRVEVAGNNVKRWKPGDEVFGDLSGRWGGFAEYVCASENALELKPTNMTFEEAAAVPQAGLLALQGLRHRGQIQPGQKILINGAGGGVGTYAVQIAKLYGAHVTGVDRFDKLDMLRSMSFDEVIDYSNEDFTKNGKCYDLILDAKTNRSVFDYARALSPNGTYVTVGGLLTRLLQVLLLGPLIALTTNKAVRILALRTNKGLTDLKELIEAGKIVSVVDGPYRLNDVPEAFSHFGQADHKGKVVITMDQLDVC